MKQLESGTIQRIIERRLSELMAFIVIFALAFKFWPEVTLWQLGDNDNFLRLHQVQTFINSPSWHVLPLADFNPQDGKVIHWSRLPDVPILAAFYFNSFFFDSELALKLAITVTPLIYLFFIMLAITKLTRELIGSDGVLLSSIYVATSLAAAKCFPGQIDHHNAQLLMFTLFMYAICSPSIERRQFTFLTVFSITTSLLIGLEVLPFFVILLGIFCLECLHSKTYKLIWVRDSSLLIVLWGAIGLWACNQIDEIIRPKFDVLSLSLLGYFLAAGVILTVTSLKPTFLTLALSTTAVLGAMFVWNADAISSPYTDYPEMLRRYWLNHVVEAEPLFELVLREKSIVMNFLSTQNVIYAVTIIPATVSILFLKNQQQKRLWVIFVLTLLPAIFWQIRTLAFSSLIAVPLQAYLGGLLWNKIKIPIVRLVPVLLLSPMVAAFAVQAILQDEKKTDLTTTTIKREGVEFIGAQQLEPSKIFAPMEQGAQILSLTDHSIIAAPYHRNIRGNLLYLNVLLTMELDDAYRALTTERIDYLFFDIRDRQIVYLKRGATRTSLLTLLIEERPPTWLELVASEGETLWLYKVVSDESIEVMTETKAAD